MIFTTLLKRTKTTYKVIDRIAYPNTERGKNKALSLIDGSIKNPSKHRITKTNKTHKLILIMED